MLYQLPNGKVVEVSTEQYLEMSDEELEYLIAFNYGDAMEDPWFGSVIKKGGSLSEEFPPDLPEIIDVSEDEKLNDLDIDYREDP